MTYLVAGASEVDAGKTTFSVGLIEYLDGVGFKPRAGNDYWYDHDAYRRAIREGTVYGDDARRLAKASAVDVGPPEINPVHRLWRPTPVGDDFLGRPDRQFVLDRVGEEFVVNAEGDLPESAEEALQVADAPRVSSVDELNDQIRSRHLPYLEALGERVANAEKAVVESYGDVARPIRGLEPDRVAVVEPGRVRVYEGDRYANACEVASGTPKEGRLEAVVEDVVDPLDPIATSRLPPLETDERSDPGRVADAYAHAYESLLG